MARDQSGNTAKFAGQIGRCGRSQFNIIVPGCPGCQSPAAQQTIDRDFGQVAGIEFEAYLRPIIITQQGRCCPAHRILQLMNVEHRAVRAAEFFDVLSLNPTGELIICARLNQRPGGPA